MTVDSVVLLDRLAERMDAFDGDGLDRLHWRRAARRRDWTHGVERILERRDDRRDGQHGEEEHERKRNGGLRYLQLVDRRRLGGSSRGGGANLFDEIAREQLVESF